MHDDGVGDEQAEDEREEHRHAEAGSGGATERRDEQHLGRGLRPDAMDGADREGRLGSVGARLEGLDVAMAMDLGSEPAPAVAHAVEGQHPSTAQPERRPVADIAVGGVEHPEAEQDEGHADDRDP